MTLDPDHVQTHDKNITLTLGDKIPSEIKMLGLGGNGSNAAVGLTRLEIPTSFYTFLGGDILSQEIAAGLTHEGVDLLAQKDGGTTSMSIIFDFDSDRIIFTHHQPREHNFKLSNTNFDYIYLHSVGKPWEDAYRQVLAYSKANNIPIAFAPGSFQIETGGEVFDQVVKNSKIFFSNREEAEKILNTKYEIPNTKELLLAIKKLGPSIVSITDGANGSYALDENENVYFIKPSPTEGSEKTGAGDAYASAFFASILHGNDIPTAMLWGVYNAEGVMGQIGAQTGLLTRQKLDEKLKDDTLKAEKV